MGLWQGLRRKAGGYRLSLAHGLPQGSIANVWIKQLVASLQNRALLAEMLGTGGEVRSYPWPGEAQGMKQECCSGVQQTSTDMLCPQGALLCSAPGKRCVLHRAPG